MIFTVRHLFVYAPFFAFTTKAHGSWLLYFRCLSMSGILTENCSAAHCHLVIDISCNKIKCYGIIILFDAR